MQNITPIEYIKLLEKTFNPYEKYSAGCLKFHLLLKTVFPEAEGWYNNNHVLTEIGGVFYDYRGIQDNKGYLPFKDHGYSFILKQFHVDDVVKEVFNKFYENL